MRGLSVPMLLLLLLLICGAEPPDADPFAPGARFWEPPQRPYDPVVEMTKAKDWHELGYFYVETIQRRERTIERLLKIVADETLDRSGEGPVAHAVALLGTFRAIEAAEPLAKMISYQPKGWLQDGTIPPPPPLTFHYFPAATALGKIGQPAVPYMLRILTNKKSTPLERKLAAWVLLQVEMNVTREFFFSPTPEEHVRSVVVSRLEYWKRNAERNGNEVARRNYEDAIAFVREYEESPEHPDEIPGFRESARFRLRSSESAEPAESLK